MPTKQPTYCLALAKEDDGSFHVYLGRVSERRPRTQPKDYVHWSDHKTFALAIRTAYAFVKQHGGCIPWIYLAGKGAISGQHMKWAMGPKSQDRNHSLMIVTFLDKHLINDRGTTRAWRCWRSALRDLGRLARRQKAHEKKQASEKVKP